MNQKIIESAIYVTTRITEPTEAQLYNLLFLADITHLSKYERFITDDIYIRGNDGVIPKGTKQFLDGAKPQVFFNMCKDGLLPSSKAQLDVFSDSDLAMFDAITSRYKYSTDKDLVYIVQYFISDIQGVELNLKGIVSVLPNRDELTIYLENEGVL